MISEFYYALKNMGALEMTKIQNFYDKKDISRNIFER